MKNNRPKIRILIYKHQLSKKGGRKKIRVKPSGILYQTCKSKNPKVSSSSYSSKVIPNDSQGFITIANHLAKVSKSNIRLNGLFALLPFDKLSPTAHFNARCERREICMAEVNYALSHGRLFRGYENTLKVKIHKTPWVLSTLGLNLDGLTVVLSLDGVLITTYRHHIGLNRLPLCG